MMQVLINPIIAICVMICFLALLICITLNNMIGKLYKYQIRKNGFDNRITRQEAKNLQRVLNIPRDGIIGGRTLWPVERAHRCGCPMTDCYVDGNHEVHDRVIRDHVGVQRWKEATDLIADFGEWERYGFKKVREYKEVEPGFWTCKEKYVQINDNADVEGSKE